MFTALRYSPLLLLPLGAPCTAAEQPCASPAQCNQVGSAAYRAGDYAAAIAAFERQLRRAEHGEDQVQRELALNNLMLANLKAAQPGMARAWLRVALDGGLTGPATRHNLGTVGAVDLAALAAKPDGHYLRYAGQAVWSTLDIVRHSDGSYRAQFFPLRAGGSQVEEWGPAAIGELQGRLAGAGSSFKLEDAGLGADCSVQLLRNGLELRVVEVFAAGCQDYGGANISVGGVYSKVGAAAAH